MEDNDFALEEHTCLKCGQKIRIVVLEKNQELSEKYQRLIMGSDTIIIEKGEFLTCPKCENKIHVV